MSNTCTIKIDGTTIDDVLSMVQVYKDILPTKAAMATTAGITQTKDEIVVETVKILNVDDQRVNSEIRVETDTEKTLDGYKATIISTGKPIQFEELAEDAVGWSWKNPAPVHVQIYRTGDVHEFRHVFVAGKHIYGRRANTGHGGDSRIRPWMKYVASGRALGYPIERLQTVRVQDIQAQPDFIEPIMDSSVEIIAREYEIALEEVFANV